MTTPSKCPTCGGPGFLPFKEGMCPTCKGTGLALDDELALCKGCNTMKHLNANGLCGRCADQLPETGAELEHRVAKLEKQVELLTGHIHQFDGSNIGAWAQETEPPLVEGINNEGQEIWKKM